MNANDFNINQRLIRLYAAMGRVLEADLGTLTQTSTHSESRMTITLGFQGNDSPADLENAAQLLIANIASLKDHLKVWCQENGHEFVSEALLDRDLNVAIVHDLWNLEKHGKLNRSSRSGLNPRLQDIVAAMEIPPRAQFTLHVMTGQYDTEDGGLGVIRRVIDGDVIDSNGNIIGQFPNICKAAVTSWEQEIGQYGIVV